MVTETRTISLHTARAAGIRGDVAGYEISQADADRLGEKLQGFYDGLDAPEKSMMQAVLLQCVNQPEVAGYAKYDLTLHADIKNQFGNPVGPTNPGGSSGPVTATVGVSFTIHF